MTTITALLEEFSEAGLLEPADRHLAQTLARLGGEDSPEVILAAALAARAPRHGHVAVDLATVSQTALAEITPERVGDEDLPERGSEAVSWPAPGAWRDAVAGSPLVCELADPRGIPDPTVPLVLVGTLLYLQKYWVYERVVAGQLIRRSVAAATQGVPALEVAPHLLRGEGSSEQLTAVTAAMSQGLLVLVGGPGTGKTTTVAALVLELHRQHLTGNPLRVALAAPTGKAAARMGEAFADAVRDLPAEITTGLLEPETSTIHRLLGASRQSPTMFRHHRDRPLPHDVVIVDEASMVSMPLMARLLDAIRPDARCVIVGDPGQLASVEAGSVLADIVAASPPDSSEPEPASTSAPAVGAPQRVVRLRVSRRFGEGTPIATLASAINAGDADTAVNVLQAPESAPVAAEGHSLGWITVAAGVHPLQNPGLRHQIEDLWQPSLEGLLTAAVAGDAGAALEAMKQTRVLCAHRRGPFGVQDWNRFADIWLRTRLSALETIGAGVLRWWYPGRVVMVTANDSRVGLFNGDLGVVIRDRGRLLVAVDGAGGPRLLPTGRFEGVEPAAAMTIHKSQGSEFDHVVVVVPTEESRLLSRELLYTGVTRAKKRVTVVGSEAAVRTAIGTRVSRASGLRDQLW